MRPAMTRAVLKALSKVAGNRGSQSFLEKFVAAAQYLQGIGSGAAVGSSGEPAILAKLAARAQGDERTLCIFDVGANTGQFLKSACEAFRHRRFHVHSFEPSLAAYSQLQEAAKSYNNVTINHFALGHKAGEQELFYDVPGSALASLNQRRLTHFGVDMRLSETVKVETLDGYCKQRGIEYVDLLKLDVEGHELAVLNGASGMFRDSRIGMVTFEFGGCNIDSRTFVQDFFYFFLDQGMRIARITPSGFCYELLSYREILEQFRTTNFVCYRD